MTFKEAGLYVLPFGKRRGERICDVALSDDGLRYLDWMSGAATQPGPTKDALECYLGDPAIAREIENLVGKDED